MFWFYTIPLLVCILTGIYFFTGEKKNIALGLVIRLAVFARMGLYQRYWRYASIEELDRIALAVLLSTLLLFLLVLLALLFTVK